MVQHFRRHFFLDVALPALLCLVALPRQKKRMEALLPRLPSWLWWGQASLPIDLSMNAKYDGDAINGYISKKESPQKREEKGRLLADQKMQRNA